MKEKTLFDTVKTIAGIIIFILLLSVLLIFIGKAFLPQDHGVDKQQHQYYHFRGKTINVLFDGNSTVRQGFSPNVLWHEYGMPAYSRVEGRQSPELTYFEAKDTIDHYDVKVVVMGVSRIFREYEYKENEPMLRRSMDYKHLSLEKIKTAINISAHTDLMQTITYIFPILRYHSRWTDLTYEEASQSYETDSDIWRGQLWVKSLKIYEPRILAETSTEVPAYSKDAIKWYIKTIELCKKKGIDVILVSMPELTHTQGMHEGIQNFADKYGVDYIDFNTDEMVEKTGLRYDEDFSDKHHLNMTGATKLTRYVGDFIVEHFNVPQWECSEETKKVLDSDYDEFSKEYEDAVKKLKKQKKEQLNKKKK